MEPMNFWVGFMVMIFALLALDLGVLNRGEQEISFRKSVLWVGLWVAVALLFNAFIYWWKGPEKGIEFLTGYVVEWSLSVDNLFVFIVIFNYFKVPKEHQYRVLFWGIIGAFILRGIFIFTGIALFHLFDWMTYVFGGILIYTGVKMLVSKDDEDPALDQNVFVKLFVKYFSVTKEYRGNKFFVRENATLFATPLFVVLLVVDFTDVIFAVDSIPAVLSITQDTFIVFASNVFAILGLRALYFAIAGMVDLFKFLQYGLAIVLSFIGIKMAIANFYVIPTIVALMMVVLVLGSSVIISLLHKRYKQSA
jgi:tellurite resistance protein TerC